MTAPGRSGPAVDATSVDATSGMGSATWLAERALLGALLRRPERTTRLDGWLSASDFADPQHRAVFTAIAGLHRAGEMRAITADPAVLAAPDEATSRGTTTNVLAVREALHSGRFGTVEVTSYPELLTDLYAAGSSAGGEHFLRYGQMVVEMSARRQLEGWGVRLELAATTPQTAEGELAALQATREAMMAELTTLARQVLQGREQDGMVGGFVGAAEAPVIQPSAPLPPKLVERAERHVIHAVIADPRWREEGLLDRLRPEDFASQAHANTWRAIQAVAKRGEPVDPVTVAWEAEVVAQNPRSGFRAEDRAVLSAVELSGMSTAPTGDTGRMISTIARSSLTKLAREARQEIAQAAADRGRGVQDALATGRAAGERLEEHASRLGGTPAKPAELSPMARRLAGERDPATITAPAPTPGVPRAR